MSNEFLPFCPVDSGTNLLTQVEYSAATDRTQGNQPGVASSKLNNKALRQSTYIASQVAQYIANTGGGIDVLDNADPSTLLIQLRGAFGPINPSIQKFISGSGTYNRSYTFIVASANATIGATYTNNTNTFTVSETISGATTLIMTGTGLPTGSGTLQKTSGTGDNNITFYLYRTPLYLRVRMVGGGGGGGGSSGAATDAGDGADGTNTTFGISLLTAGGGGKGKAQAVEGGSGGTASIVSPALGTALAGGIGGVAGASGSSISTGSATCGGSGGASAFGGNGGGGQSNSVGVSGTPGQPNTGGGGGGANIANQTSGLAGSGGGAGGFVDALIRNPSDTYAYAVGPGGAGGTAGTGGSAGSDGGSGYIEVTEYYQ